MENCGKVVLIPFPKGSLPMLIRHQSCHGNIFGRINVSGTVRKRIRSSFIFSVVTTVHPGCAWMNSFLFFSFHFDIGIEFAKNSVSRAIPCMLNRLQSGVRKGAAQIVLRFVSFCYIVCLIICYKDLLCIFQDDFCSGTMRWFFQVPALM